MLVGTVELVVVAEQFERSVTILLGEHAELFAASVRWLPVVDDENLVHALMLGHSQQHRQAREVVARDGELISVPRYPGRRVPENVWAPESQYQIGICQQRLGQPAAAAVAFRRTVEQYESSRWSGLAADRLRALEAIPWEGTR